jgi:hypothetical protein
MKRLFLFLTLSLAIMALMPSKTGAQTRKESRILYHSQYNYEIEPLGVGQDGTKVFKVWGVGKDVPEAIMKAKSDAIAACIFKGLTGGAGSAPTPPILTEPNAEVTYSAYFEKFFETGGKYLQYIAVTTDGDPAGQDRLKLKRGYKVAINVQVMYDALRKQLEADNIARRLDKGF